MLHFNDAYGTDCSIQESSSCDPCIWLGVHRADVKIMYKDSVALGLGLEKLYPETNENGWCRFPVPDEALVESRMHLNREQARKLAATLLFFSETGFLPDEKYSPLMDLQADGGRPVTAPTMRRKEADDA